MKMNYTNRAPGAELMAAVSGTATTLIVDTVTGFPPTPFYVIINPDNDEEEVAKVTGISGTSLTVERGITDTGTASNNGNAHAVGASVIHGAVAWDFNQLSAVFEALEDPNAPGTVLVPIGKPVSGLVWGDLL